MFYRKDHGYIFVHNPKTAGRSIRVALNYDKPELMCPVSHVPLYAIDDHADYFSFGFVRNPWDRLVSYYCYLCQREDAIEKDNYPRAEVINMGFNRWLLDSKMILFGDDHPDVNIGIMKSVQARSQMWWLNGCNFIGKFENLQKDFNYVCSRIGKERTILPRKDSNYTTHSHYGNYYNEESIEIVRETYTDEIKQFGFKFYEKEK